MSVDFVSSPIVVVGYGSIGRRHLDVLRELLPQTPLWVVRRRVAPLEPRHRDVTVTDDLAAALALKPAAVVLCSPAPRHADQAVQCLQAGIAVLSEKPLAADLADARRIVAAVTESGAILQVGYCLRYAPSLRAARQALQDGRIGRLVAVEAEVGQDLRDWRPGADWTQGVSANRDLGGGALLELSHEIDLVRLLAGDVVSVMAEVGNTGLLPGLAVEDWADLLVQCETGVRARIHLDMVQRPARRRCRLIGSDGVIEWDGVAGQAKLFQRSAHAWGELPVASVERNHLFREQWRDFQRCVETRAQPLVGAQDGLKTLEIACAAARSAALGQRIGL